MTSTWQSEDLLGLVYGRSEGYYESRSKYNILNRIVNFSFVNISVQIILRCIENIK